MNDIFYQYVM